MNIRPAIDIRTASTMWSNDASMGEIAERFGVSRGAVAGVMNRNRELFPKKTGGERDFRSPGYAKAEKKAVEETDNQSDDVRSARACGAEYDVERIPHAKTLLDLDRHDCRWPVSERPYLFCAADATGEHQNGLSPYCRHHYLRRLPLRSAANVGET